MMARRVVLFLPILTLAAATPLRGQGYSPQEAVRRMTVADGLEVCLVASEPLIRQPVAIDFDDRGRLWVIQYLQYPNPAGLKRAQVDRYSRTKYDQVPDPPPKGPTGADRITILLDTDGDGRADKAKDFLSGLNLASGFAFGDGGVYVLQAPYLLFYPDKNRDDVPDGDPAVLLKGFGMEDAHSVANSLTWGPDGWLYGLQGSTVTANIEGNEFQQGVWRYHPPTKRFELFAEGGGNMWGLDFDAAGRLIASTNVGGYTCLHFVQGGYYWKSFGKHGELHNPFAYGYLDHIPIDQFRGGHVSVGGIVYQGGAFPDRFNGAYIYGDLLGHTVNWHTLRPDGSTLRAGPVQVLLDSHDTWFATSDVTLGPYGFIYVADWHDQRTAHPDPDAEWDRSNGRIYCIAPKGHKSTPLAEIAAKSPEEVRTRLKDQNVWQRRRTLQKLRSDDSSIEQFSFFKRVLDAKPADASIWDLWAFDAVDRREGPPLSLLEHPDEHIRTWTVRRLGNEPRPVSSEALQKMAQTESSPIVLSQLAASARRLSSTAGLAVVNQMLMRDPDINDRDIPMMLWWAVERHSQDLHTLTALQTRRAWNVKVCREIILPRVVRKFASMIANSGDRFVDGKIDRLDSINPGPPTFETAALAIMNRATTDSDRDLVVSALDVGLRGNKREVHVPLVLREWMQRDRFLELQQEIAGADANRRSKSFDAVRLSLAARIGQKGAERQAVYFATNSDQRPADRLKAIEILRDWGSPACVDTLLALAAGDDYVEIKQAALQALRPFDDSQIGVKLFLLYRSTDSKLRPVISDMMLGRHAWATQFLAAVDRGGIDPKDVPVDQLSQVALHKDRALDEIIVKHWGVVKEKTPEEKLAEVRRLNNDLNAGPGDRIKGKEVYKQHCAACHKLFGDGNTVGPDLTHANRKDRQFLLVTLVDPSAVVRREYLSHVVQSTDGRIATGLITEQTPGSVTLVTAKNERLQFRRDEIETMRESPTSLMPEDLYRQLSPPQLRDLFAYLQSDDK